MRNGHVVGPSHGKDTQIGRNAKPIKEYHVPESFLWSGRRFCGVCDGSCQPSSNRRDDYRLVFSACQCLLCLGEALLRLHN